MTPSSGFTSSRAPVNGQNSQSLELARSVMLLLLRLDSVSKKKFSARKVDQQLMISARKTVNNGANTQTAECKGCAAIAARATSKWLVSNALQVH